MLGESDQMRTAKEVAKAMSSLVKYLSFKPVILVSLRKAHR